MKKLIAVAFLALIAGNGFGQSKKYVTFKADIANKNGDEVYIQTLKGKVLKKIQIGSDGTFKDTIHLKKEGLYQFFDGTEYTQLYLKNGYDLKLKMDATQFDESIVYSGKGADENNFLAQNALYEEKYNYDKLFAADETQFNSTLESKKQDDLKKLTGKKLDPDFVAVEKENIDGAVSELKAYYKENLEKRKLNNTQSPSFDYENFKGGKTKLEDLRGKYVYIDVWATWCGPCRAEIPYLQKVEEKYKGKNIAFVSLSVDVKKDYEKWKKMIVDKSLGGIQLIADKDWTSDFITAYNINSIPRFILIDPKGSIINADAARPSDPELQVLFDSLLN